LLQSGSIAPHRRIAFPLDYPTLAEARAGADKLRGHVGILKVGLQLFTKEGPRALALADGTDAELFADLKLHDIPQTVEGAIASIAQSSTRYVTVHAAGGAAMLSRAAERAERDTGGKLVVLAVTVLTSLDDADLRAQGVGESAAEHALRLARLAWQAGIRGFVCSPFEVESLRRQLGPDALLVTPGVRPAGNQGDDQKRTATAEEAVARGADILVVGRPLRDAPDPAAAARELAEQIAKGLALREPDTARSAKD
jgi:orotidine-5'-phosphate decarboxylase